MLHYSEFDWYASDTCARALLSTVFSQPVYYIWPSTIASQRTVLRDCSCSVTAVSADVFTTSVVRLRLHQQLR